MIAGVVDAASAATTGPTTTVSTPTNGPTTTAGGPGPTVNPTTVSSTTAAPPTTAAGTGPPTSQPAGATTPPTTGSGTPPAGAPSTSAGSTTSAGGGSAAGVSTTSAGGSTTSTAPKSTTTLTPAVPNTLNPVALGPGPPAGVPLGPLVQAEQLQVVSRDYQVPVNQASNTLNTAMAHLKAAQTALTADTKASHDAAGAVTAEIHTMATDRVARARAVQAYDRTISTLARDRRRMRAIAVALYVGGPTAAAHTAHASANSAGDSAAGSQLGLVQETGDAVESLTIAETTTGSNLGPDANRVAAAVRHQTDLVTKVRADTNTLRLDRARVKAYKVTLETDRAKIDIVKAPIPVDQTRLAAARHAQTVAEAEFTPPPRAVSATTRQAAGGAAALVGGPTILGPPALTAAQLIGWFNHSGYMNLTKATVAELVNWYLGNGAIEGIRGDLAFAQAVHETAGFSSRDAVTFNNYAGVGHCDACMSGLKFPSPEEGVIGQLQLLRTYADADSAQGLPQPLALSELNPANASALGCCGTWNSLTGKWASDPAYGTEILRIYYSMLQYALSHPPVAPSAPSATPPAPPATPGKPS